jgi:hypothetical protein
VTQCADHVALCNFSDDFRHRADTNGFTQSEKFLAWITVIEIHCPVRMLLTAVCARNVLVLTQQHPNSLTFLLLIFTSSLEMLLPVLMVVLLREVSLARLTVCRRFTARAKCVTAQRQSLIAARTDMSHTAFDVCDRVGIQGRCSTRLSHT